MSLDQVRDAASSFDAANEVRGAAERCGLEVSMESFAGGVRAVLKDPNRDDAVVYGLALRERDHDDLPPARFGCGHPGLR